MTPAYFNPAAQPDTETQYRRGGKVNKMQKLSVAKKMPRKFGEGGKTTAPALTGMALEVENARRDARVKKEKEAYEAQRPNSLGPRPTEKPEVKKAKGGAVKKVRKFADGGETDPDRDVDVRMDYGIDSDNGPLKRISDVSGSRFSPDTYARAKRFLDSGKKDDVAAAASTYKASPKKVSTVANTPKKEAPSVSAPKKEAPRFTAEGEMNSNVRQEAPRKRGMYERGAGPMLPEPLDSGKQPSGPTAPEKARAKRLNDEAEARVAAAKNRKYANSPVTKAKDEYEGMSPSEVSLARGDKLKKMLGLKKGGTVKKFAKGGMARGYGISKVTNKTKYC